jgi:hypothetical protein
VILNSNFLVIEVDAVLTDVSVMEDKLGILMEDTQTLIGASRVTGIEINVRKIKCITL